MSLLEMPEIKYNKIKSGTLRRRNSSLAMMRTAMAAKLLNTFKKEIDAFLDLKGSKRVEERVGM